MTGGLSQNAQYRATRKKDKKYDGLFYFAVKKTVVFCRPSCPLPRQLHDQYVFFNSIEDATAQGYHACKHCHPGRLKNDLSSEILHDIDAGVINSKGVHGFADSLHISERHLRRVVHARTGTSPQQLNKTKRLSTAKRLVTQTDLPIIDVAFSADFSSLRQFNDVFKEAFKVSPSAMRKHAHAQTAAITIRPLHLLYMALQRATSSALLTHK